MLRAWSATRSNRRTTVIKGCKTSNGIFWSRNNRTNSAFAVGETRVQLHAGLHRIVQRLHGPIRQFRQPFDGDRNLLAGQFDRLPRDALGVVPDPLQFEVDANGGINLPQRSAGRLLTAQKFQTEPVYFLFQLIDAFIPQNDRVGQLPVAFPQGAYGITHRLLAQFSHLRNLVADAIQILLQIDFVMRGHRF